MAAEAAWFIATAIAATEKAILVDIENGVDITETPKRVGEKKTILKSKANS